MLSIRVLHEPGLQFWWQQLRVRAYTTRVSVVSTFVLARMMNTVVLARTVDRLSTYMASNQQHEFGVACNFAEGLIGFPTRE